MPLWPPRSSFWTWLPRRFRPPSRQPGPSPRSLPRRWARLPGAVCPISSTPKRRCSTWPPSRSCRRPRRAGPPASTNARRCFHVPPDCPTNLSLSCQDRGRKLRGIEAGQDTTVLAEQDGKLLGYGRLHHGETRWFRHLGEVRLLVAPHQRSHGLGKVLAQEVFSIARELGAAQDRGPHGLQPEGRPPPARKPGIPNRGLAARLGHRPSRKDAGFGINVLRRVRLPRLKNA